jgi:hypothetical protein
VAKKQADPDPDPGGKKKADPDPQHWLTHDQEPVHHFKTNLKPVDKIVVGGD